MHRTAIFREASYLLSFTYTITTELTERTLRSEITQHVRNFCLYEIPSTTENAMEIIVSISLRCIWQDTINLSDNLTWDVNLQWLQKNIVSVLYNLVSHNLMALVIHGRRASHRTTAIVHIIPRDPYLMLLLGNRQNYIPIGPKVHPPLKFQYIFPKMSGMGWLC